MLRDVTLSYNSTEKTYTVDSDTHYEGRVKALRLFLDEFHIPGRPVDYIAGSKKGIIDILVKSSIDRRTIEGVSGHEGLFFLGKIGNLREYVRESNKLDEKTKTKATALLLKLEEVLSG